jgi:RNA polymerase sigma-70 factor (ECF subfamily)
MAYFTDDFTLKKTVVDKKIHTSLLKGLKSGSYEDFDKLYAIYSDLLYGFVLNLTKSSSDAQDILQETFLRIWQTRMKISEDRSFKSYLYTIARNLIVDSFRNRMKSVALEEYICSEAYQNHAENNVEKDLDFDEFVKMFEKAKGKLTGKQLHIFELSREQGLSLSVIADKLNISEKTVKNQLTLVMNILRKELAHLDSGRSKML